MLGWEFPPAISGGLGVACYGLAKALNSSGVDVLFVLPKPLAKNNQKRIPGGGVLQDTREIQAPSALDSSTGIEPTPPTASLPAENPPPEMSTPAHAPSAPTHPTVTPATDTLAEQPLDSAAGEERLQRITFVPVDAWLQPYLTPDQYERMIVEEILPDHSTRRWEKRFDRGGGTWVDQPILSPAPTADARPEPATARPEPPRGRAYLDEPANAEPLLGQENTSYAGDLFTETERYARLALAIAQTETFDIIHAHDWMTFEAAMAVAAATAKPLVVQIHSTEFDRAGMNANVRILEIERKGMTAATKIVAVSYKTKTQLIDKYGIDPHKIEVVYNAVEPATSAPAPNGKPKPHKTVLFLGRMTRQKGPDYFLKAAKKLLSIEPHVKFIMAGKGEMVEELKELAEDLGIHRRVTFTGFLKKAETERAFRSADVYVMPSVSEPFGIAPLEALSHDVPVIISKQSGVAEILQHVLKVDFWDTEDLANKILAVLRHPPLAATLREHGQDEVRQLSWDDSAERILDLYKLLAPAAPTP
jgi:glycosyltransferase involved in cell wall biosynthesis